MCSIPLEQLPPAPGFDWDIERRETAKLTAQRDRDGGPEATSIVWTNRGLASDNFAATFGASANGMRAVVDAALLAWQRVITNWNRADGTTTLQVSISMATTGSGFGGAAAPNASAPADGKPRDGSISLSRGSLTADPNDSNGWFLDPTPSDNSEFQGTIGNAFAGFPQSPVGADMFSVVTIEMAHVLGIITDKFNNGSSWNGYRLESSGLAASTGVADNGEGGGFGSLWTFSGPSVHHLMTSYNSGDPTVTSWGNVVHTAGPPANIFTLGQTWIGQDDTGNAIFGSERTLPDFVVAHILQDAYGYSIADPASFGTFYAVLNQSTGVLNIRGGTGNSGDVIYVRNSGGNVQVSVDVGNDVPGTGSLSGPGNLPAWTSDFPAGSVTQISVNGGAGNDIIRIEGNQGKPTVVDGGDGDDFIDFSIDARNLDNISGGTTVGGGNGNDGIFVYDNNNTFADTFTITSSRFDRNFWGGFFYDSTVEGETLICGTGVNTVNIQSTFIGQPVFINNAGGADTVNIGNAGNGVQSINADVQVQNDPSFTTLNINDGTNATARTATIDLNGAFGYVTGLAPANIFWDTIDIAAINMTTGSAVDTVNFNRSTETFNLNSSGSQDVVNVGAAAASGVQGITGQLTIQNSPSFTHLSVDDVGDATARTVTIDVAAGFTNLTGLAPALIRWNNSDIFDVVVRTGSNVDTVNVLRSTEVTTLNSTGGGDVVNIGNATDGLQSITGAFTVQNTPSFTTLTLDDGADATGRSITVDVAAGFTNVSGFAPAQIRFNNADINTVTYIAGSGLDTFNILRSTETSTITNTGSGDNVNIGNGVDGAQSIFGNITILNPPSFTHLTVDDTADAVGRIVTLDTYVPGDGLLRGRIFNLAPATIEYRINDISTPININCGSGADSVFVITTPDFRTINLNTGAGADSVEVDFTGAGSALLLNGGPAKDTFNIIETSPTGPVTIVPSAGDDDVLVNTNGFGFAKAMFDATQRIGALNIGAGGQAVLTAGSKVLTATSVSVTGSGFLDLTDGAMIVDYTGGSPLASIGALLTSGYAGAAWNGAGINSSVAAGMTKTALGYAEATEIFGAFPATFVGQPVDGTSVLIRYTLYGDLDLNHAVNIGDFSNVAANFNVSGTRWRRGNVNYDGGTNIGDFSSLASNFNLSLPASTPAAAPSLPPPFSKTQMPALLTIQDDAEPV